MNKRLLGALARRLEKIQATPKKKRARVFDIGTFHCTDTCGTVCCALGEACYVPSIAKAGLRVDEAGSIRSPAGRHSLGAAEEVFGIGFDAAWSLFMPSSYYPATRVTPGKVAKKIREFIAKGSSEGAF